MKKNDFFAVLIGCLLILGLSQVTYALYQGSNPWPMWRYDQTHGGHTTSMVTDRNVTIWDSASYYPQTPPIVADGQVIFGGTGPRMYALDETTGVELWRSFNLVGTITGCPAFSDGRIFVATQSGYLYCINASTGVKIWENQLISSPGQIQSAPAVANGKVFVTTTDNYLFGVDIVTGQYGVWYFQAGGKIYSSPAVSGNMVYFGCDDGKVYALDISDPGGFVLIWRFPTGGQIRSSPCVAAGKVFIGSSNSDHAVFALNATTTSFNGQLIWKYTLDSAYSIENTPAYYNGVVYFTGVGSGSTGKVYALNANASPGNYTESQPGCKIWSSIIGSYMTYAYSVAVTNDKLVATDGANSVHCLNNTNGQVIWSSRFASAPYEPIIADGNVFANDYYSSHCIGDYYPPVTYYYTVTPPGAGESFDIKLVIANATPAQTIGTQLLVSQLKINYTVTGIDGTIGMSNITLPNRMLGGPYEVRVNGGFIPSPVVVDDGTYSSICFNYFQSVNQIEIQGTTAIPELSPMIVLASLMTASAVVALLAKSTRIRKNYV